MKLILSFSLLAIATGQFYVDGSDSPSSTPTQPGEEEPSVPSEFEPDTGSSPDSASPNIHGSGGTVPQKCYWNIMSKLMRQSKQFTRLTYRGVGSGSGQYEFIGNDNNYTPFSDFGAGDVPLKQSQYDEVLQNSGEMFHFPVLIGAITFFHNIDIPDDKQLNLTPCILAKILDREIEQWSDPEILAINGPLKGYIPASSPIHVARRSDGSGSTESITQYLNEACPEHWPGDLVGKSPEWKSDTLACSGSSGMVDCIDRNQGSIGYLDTGSGHVKGFSEIKLENKDGDYITSLDALENGGVLAAATSEGSNIPDQLNESFAEVNLLNQPGEYTWPIVVMAYIYVRKDLRYTSSSSQYMLKAFLRSLYMDDYMDSCANSFELTPITGELRVLALQTIDNELILDDGTDWTFELDSSIRGEGQEDFVFSEKRISSTDFDLDGLLRELELIRLSSRRERDLLEERIIQLEDQLNATNIDSETEPDDDDIPGDEGTSNPLDGKQSGVPPLNAAKPSSLLATTVMLWYIIM